MPTPSAQDTCMHTTLNDPHEFLRGHASFHYTTKCHFQRSARIFQHFVVWLKDVCSLNVGGIFSITNTTILTLDHLDPRPS